MRDIILCDSVNRPQTSRLQKVLVSLCLVVVYVSFFLSVGFDNNWITFVVQTCLIAGMLAAGFSLFKLYSGRDEKTGSYRIIQTIKCDEVGITRTTMAEFDGQLSPRPEVFLLPWNLIYKMKEDNDAFFLFEQKRSVMPFIIPANTIRVPKSSFENEEEMQVFRTHLQNLHQHIEK